MRPAAGQCRDLRVRPMSEPLTPLVIFGSGGHAREVHQLVEAINAVQKRIDFLGFLDSDPAKHGSLVHGLPVLGGGEWLAGGGRAAVHIVIAIGSPAAKRRVVHSLPQGESSPFLTLIHPGACVGNRVHLGIGCTICAGVQITTDIQVGQHVIVNTGAMLCHDVEVGDYATIAPAAVLAGAVKVGQGADIGAGCTAIQGISIGPWSITGAGSVVITDVPENVTVVGVPAKSIKRKPSGWHL